MLMKVLLVNTYESGGGAAIACSRIAKALQGEGVDTRIMVRSSKWSFLWERGIIWLCNCFSRKNLFKVSTAGAGRDITKTREFSEADAINLHWVNQGMLSLRDIEKILSSGKPVIWTMHDMWPCTGICHHACECGGYKSACGNCPYLRCRSKNDLSARVFRRKMKMFAGAKNLTFVTVSNWLAERTRQSALTGRFPVRVIPNVLPLEDFILLDRGDARRELCVEEPFVIAFGAARIDDPIKGFGYLTEALRLMTESGQYRAEDIRLLLFGGVRDTSIFDSIPVPYTYLGYVEGSAKLSQVYSAANATISSSLYETFGQTLIEALACGSLPVSFDGSGQADIISHRNNGYLAERLSAKSLAEGIAWAFESRPDALQLRQSVISRYSESVVASQYLELFK